MLPKIRLLLIIILACPAASFAQMEKIDADRPDQTDGPVIVPKKWIQLEMGLSMEQNDRSKNEYFLPTLLTRYGISKKIELRLTTSVKRYLYTSAAGSSTYMFGLDPIQIGAKITLREEKKWMPKMGVIVNMGIPGLASKNLNLDKFASSYTLSMQNTLTSNIGLGYNFGVQWDGYSNKPSWNYTFSPVFNLSEKWDGYIEVFGSVVKGEAAQHNIDVGLAYYVSNNSKIDISSGLGISKESPDWYIAIGASFRFKTSH